MTRTITVALVFAACAAACHPRFEVALTAVDDAEVVQWRTDVTQQLNENSRAIERLQEADNGS